MLDFRELIILISQEFNFLLIEQAAILLLAPFDLVIILINFHPSILILDHLL